MQHKKRLTYITGPEGQILTMADLPPPQTKRWVIRRKAEVVAAVKGGLLSVDVALERYALSPDEYRAWGRASEQYVAVRKARAEHKDGSLPVHGPARGTSLASADAISPDALPALIKPGLRDVSEKGS